MMDKVYQMKDAQGDILKMLNHMTDCDLRCLSFKDIEAIGIFSKAVKDLEKAICYAEKEAEPEEMHDKK